MPNADELVRAARVKLSHPSKSTSCLAAALWAIRLEASDKVMSNGKPTMGVDEGWTLYYHPSLNWPIEAVCTVLVHEIWHLLRRHHERAAALGVTLVNAEAWNACGDAEINDNLVADRMPFPPDFVPITPQALNQPPNLLAEEYYQRLPKSNVPVAGFGGSAADGIKRPWERGSGKGQEGKGQTSGNGSQRVVPAELIRKQVAEEIGKHAGNMPADWKRWAGQIITPRQIPWQTVFRAVVGRMVAAGRKEDYTFARMSRRQYPDASLITPGMMGTLPDVCICCDTSGSMGQSQLDESIGIVESILEHLGRAYPITVLAGDTCVQAVTRTTQGRKVNLQGGGGTDMSALIEHAADKMKPRPQIIVVVTDGYTPWPDRAPAGIQTVVVLVNDGESPTWATTVKATK